MSQFLLSCHLRGGPDAHFPDTRYCAPECNNSVLQEMSSPGEVRRGGWFQKENQFSSCEILEPAIPRLF